MAVPDTSAWAAHMLALKGGGGHEIVSGVGISVIAVRN